MSPQAHSITLAVPPEPTDHELGSEHAPVTLIEYGDFECPSCKVAVPTPRLLLDRFPNRVRFIYRHFPLQDSHPHALLAAEMDDHIYLRRVRKPAEGGRSSHIRATPAFFVNGVVQDISYGMQSLHDAVAASLHRAG